METAGIRYITPPMMNITKRATDTPFLSPKNTTCSIALPSQKRDMEIRKNLPNPVERRLSGKQKDAAAKTRKT
jgi:hypothetical protein